MWPAFRNTSDTSGAILTSRSSGTPSIMSIVSRTSGLSKSRCAGGNSGGPPASSPGISARAHGALPSARS
jgi:hypothetical protein